MTRRDEHGPADDDLLPRLFRALGPAPTLPVDMKRAWESAFGNELMLQIAARRRRRNRFAMGCAGIVALVGFTGYLLPERPEPSNVVAEVARVDMVTGHAESASADATRRVGIGDELGPGQTVRTGPDTSLALRYRGAEIRLNSNTVVELLPNHLRLLNGDIYVDAGAAPRHAPAISIKTSRGVFAHLGTQFQVSVAVDEVRAAVREGAITFTGDGELRTVTAEHGATELVVGVAGIATRRIDPVGERWAWTIEAAAGYIVDGRTADEFLAWAARQTGTELRYTDDAARDHAKHVIVQGAPRPLSVAQGLEMLDATTGLDLDESDPLLLQVTLERHDHAKGRDPRQ